MLNANGQAVLEATLSQFPAGTPDPADFLLRGQNFMLMDDGTLTLTTWTRRESGGMAQIVVPLGTFKVEDLTNG